MLEKNTFTPRFGTKSIVVHHCNGCYIKRSRQRTLLCEKTREEAEEHLELWRNAIENKGLRVSRNKTEYLPPSSCHDKVKFGGKEIENVTFKYIGSMFDTEGGTTTDCNNRVRLAWNKWREETGVICDKKVPVKLKHKIYKTIIRPTMTYGAECWTM